MQAFFFSNILMVHDISWDTSRNVYVLLIGRVPIKQIKNSIQVQLVSKWAYPGLVARAEFAQIITTLGSSLVIFRQSHCVKDHLLVPPKTLLQISTYLFSRDKWMFLEKGVSWDCLESMMTSSNSSSLHRGLLMVPVF